MRKTTMATVLLLGLAFGGTPRVGAEVKVHGLFQDNMVLQRDMPVPVWGTADPGAAVTVGYANKTPNGIQNGSFTVNADAKGQWRYDLPAMEAGTASIKVSGPKTELLFKQLLVGEVWICGGQSNMEWAVQQTRDPKEIIANSRNDNIRLFDVPKTPTNNPQAALGAVKEPQKGRVFGKWLECGPTTVPTFSGVGYFFGRKLEKDLNVPVGLINSSWGGTAAERWIAKSVLETNPELAGTKGSDLYNGMIAPLAPFAFRGVIWYQGESNAGKAKQYYHLMNALIKNWRDDWKQGDFPFLTVQLAPWDQPKVEGQWAEIREAQWFTARKLKNVGQAVITDAGDPKDIHPKDKAVVGERLELLALATAYGKKIVHSGPEFDSVKFAGGKATLTFKHVGGGLVAKGGALVGFTVAGKDGKFAKGEATIVENTVIVRSPEVPEPAAVRYGWANYPVCNLYNQEDLPATPFRSDVPTYLK